MAKSDRRRELLAEYKERKVLAGIYRIVSRESGFEHLDTARDLESARGKFEFLRSTNTTSFMDKDLQNAIEAEGFDKFEFEVLETLEVKPDVSRQQLDSDLAELLELVRER